VVLSLTENIFFNDPIIVTSKPVKAQESTSVRINVTSDNSDEQACSWEVTERALEQRLNILDEKIGILGLKNRIEKKRKDVEKLEVDILELKKNWVINVFLLS